MKLSLASVKIDPASYRGCKPAELCSGAKPEKNGEVRQKNLT